MICEACKKEGLKSRVYEGAGFTTAMHCPSFYDEEGKSHTHDSNVTSWTYSCSNGHRWETRESGSCWCGWPKKENT